MSEQLELVGADQSGGSAVVQPKSTKSRTIASILCFFFGLIGVHRFYTGKVGTGVLEIIVFLSILLLWPVFLSLLLILGIGTAMVGNAGGVGATAMSVVGWFLYIPAMFVWPLIDFICILCGVFKDKQKLPITKW